MQPTTTSRPNIQQQIQQLIQTQPPQTDELQVPGIRSYENLPPIPVAREYANVDQFN
jgi:hypothetical protein